jgi:hypothetical protein
MMEKPEFNTYIIHQALLIISPVLLAIVEYITLGKLQIDLATNNSGISHSHGHSVAPAANAHNPTVRRRTNSPGRRLGRLLATAAAAAACSTCLRKQFSADVVATSACPAPEAKFTAVDGVVWSAASSLGYRVTGCCRCTDARICS